MNETTEMLEKKLREAEMKLSQARRQEAISAFCDGFIFLSKEESYRELRKRASISMRPHLKEVRQLEKALETKTRIVTRQRASGINKVLQFLRLDRSKKR